MIWIPKRAKTIYHTSELLNSGWSKHIFALTEPVLLKAGKLWEENQISLAESIITVYACIYDVTFLQKDFEHETLAMVNQVKLIYKPKHERKGTVE